MHIAVIAHIAIVIMEITKYNLQFKVTWEINLKLALKDLIFSSLVYRFAGKEFHPCAP